MTMGVEEGTPPGRLVDYRTHYQVDAEAIVDPRELSPARRASEQRRFQALVRLLRLRPGDRLLDIGCGSGWLAAQGAAAGAAVWAMDIAPSGVTAARDRFPTAGQFQAGDVYNLPFASESFDALVLSEVLEHLEDVHRALGEVHRVLRPGGRAVASVPHREQILQHLCIHCNRLTPAHAHLHSFDAAKLSSCVEARGLEVQLVQLLTNKVLELVGFPSLTHWLPYRFWRSADWLLNRLVGRAGFVCALAVRKA